MLFRSWLPECVEVPAHRVTLVVRSGDIWITVEVLFLMFSYRCHAINCYDEHRCALSLSLSLSPLCLSLCLSLSLSVSLSLSLSLSPPPSLFCILALQNLHYAFMQIQLLIVFNDKIKCNYHKSQSESFGRFRLMQLARMFLQRYIYF